MISSVPAYMGHLSSWSDGRHFDPETDKILMVGRGPNDDNDPVLINGSSTPAPLKLRTGTRYRFRIIQITPGNSVQMSLKAVLHPASYASVSRRTSMPAERPESPLRGNGGQKHPPAWRNADPRMQWTHHPSEMSLQCGDRQAVWGWAAGPGQQR